MSDSVSPLKGKTIVFTGEIEGLTRRQLKAIASEVGATVRTGVSAKTDFVVAGRDAGKKLQEAANNNVTILTKDAFFDLVRQQRTANKLAPN